MTEPAQWLNSVGNDLKIAHAESHGQDHAEYATHAVKNRNTDKK